jgi:hypothetical protein
LPLLARAAAAAAPSAAPAPSAAAAAAAAAAKQEVGQEGTRRQAENAALRRLLQGARSFPLWCPKCPRRKKYPVLVRGRNESVVSWLGKAPVWSGWGRDKQ